MIVRYNFIYFNHLIIIIILFTTKESVGQIVVFDNFSNVKPRYFNSNEAFISVFNDKQQEKWKKFDTLGTGYSWNNNGDLFSITALSASK